MGGGGRNAASLAAYVARGERASSRHGVSQPNSGNGEGLLVLHGDPNPAFENANSEKLGEESSRTKRCAESGARSLGVGIGFRSRLASERSRPPRDLAGVRAGRRGS